MGTKRIEVCCLFLSEFLVRIGTLNVWFPYMLILIVPAIGSGRLDRKVKLFDFDCSSPLTVQAAFHLMVIPRWCFCRSPFLR
ncbi:DUF4400 domain-containing protein [Succinimonas sp.]|uniref:DUF4400 domain-containing protein n=1 Tax=Succinimonas sp. TaxID=1936151 RepID=UPI00387069CA